MFETIIRFLSGNEEGLFSLSNCIHITCKLNLFPVVIHFPVVMRKVFTTATTTTAQTSSLLSSSSEAATSSSTTTTTTTTTTTSTSHTPTTTSITTTKTATTSRMRSTKTATTRTNLKISPAVKQEKCALMHIFIECIFILAYFFCIHASNE